MGAFPALQLAKAARPGHVRRGVATLFGGAVVAVLSWVVWQPGGGVSPPGEPHAATPGPVMAPPLQRYAEPAMQQQPLSAPGVLLLEVGTSVRSGRDVAVMRVDGAAPARFGVGDSVAAGVRLVAILPEHVELQRGGRIERVMLTRLPDASAAPSTQLRPLRAMRHGADAAGERAAAPAADVIVRGVDSAPPSSTAIDRAIARASVHAAAADARTPR